MTREELTEILAAPDPEIRRRGVIELSQAASEGTTELLSTALGDVDWRVRKEAVRVAGSLAGTLPIIPAMVSAVVQGENVGLRNAALEVLGLLGSAATDALLSEMRVAPAGARKFLIAALGDSGDLEAVHVLAEEAVGDDANNAAAAIDALSRLGGPSAERALRGRLGSDDPFQRMAALDGLNRLRAIVPWEELEPVLDDRLLRRLVLSVLGRCGREEAARPLADALLDRSAAVVAIAAVALVHLYDHSDRLAEVVGQHAQDLGEPPRAALRQLVTEGDLPTRQAAAHLLLAARDERGLEAVCGLAAESALPPSALSALSSWGGDAARPLLAIEARASGAVKATALELAADLAADAESIDPTLERDIRAAILAALGSQEPTIAKAAARSLAWWARASDVPKLVELAAQAPGEIAHACGAALEALATTTDMAPVAEALSAVPLDGPSGPALAGVVARLRIPGAFEQLQAGLSAQDPEVRRASVHALASLGGQRAAELIGYALADETLDVRTTAARALGYLRAEDGRPLGADALLLALDAESPAVQAAAARALGGLADGRAIEPLRELVRQGEAGVSVAAMEALRSLSDPLFDDLLVDALGHPDEEVVKQALKAIRDAQGPRTVGRLAVGLEHPAWHVRGLSARLLGDVGSDDAYAILEERRRGEKDPMVIKAIARALSGRGRG